MRTHILAASVALVLASASTFAVTTTTPATSAATSSSTVATGTATPPANATSDSASAANNAPRFGAGSTFANDSGNAALGTSVGQTSSGTAAGNSSVGIGASSATLGTDGASGGTTLATPSGTVAVLPGDSGARSGVHASTQTTTTTVIDTPLFDQAAREGLARERARRARGDEPRVYGIAPRTENDLTWQMPDDRIIRY